MMFFSVRQAMEGIDHLLVPRCNRAAVAARYRTAAPAGIGRNNKSGGGQKHLFDPSVRNYKIIYPGIGVIGKSSQDTNKQTRAASVSKSQQQQQRFEPEARSDRKSGWSDLVQETNGIYRKQIRFRFPREIQPLKELEK